MRSPPSAFGTIQPHLLVVKLLKMKVSIPTILWILDYMTDRPQFVKSGSEVSNSMLINTGAPQGSALSPFHFHYTLPTAGVLMIHARLTSLLMAQDRQD